MESDIPPYLIELEQSQVVLNLEECKSSSK